MFVFKVAVVGAGTMGSQIAHALASASIPVVLEDVERRFVDEGIDRVRARWRSQVEAGALDVAEAERLQGLITGATGYDDFGDVDFLIEAVPERSELKQTVFAELDEVTPGHAILASNTSALSISEMAMATGRPDQVVGFHFFHPVSAMRVIEVVEGDDTSAETMQAAFGLAQAIRKLPIRCGDAPGFVVNRILNAAVSELWRVQEETGIEIERLDELVAEAETAGAGSQGSGRPGAGMGPFYRADVLGLDTVLDVAQQLREAYGERFFVHQRMSELVSAGNLGVKTGRGFYGHGG